jgi:hypothetical protein
MLGTERTPLSGRNSKHTASDTLHEKLFVECKKLKRMAIHNLYRKTKELADKETKIPVVITKETGKQIILVTARIEHLREVLEYLEENK